MYAEIAVDTGAASLDVFTYLVPESLRDQVKRGVCVLVPFGTRQNLGFVVTLTNETNLEKVRELIAVVETSAELSSELLSLAEWISARWLCGLTKTLPTVLPRVMSSKVRTKLELTNVNSPAPTRLAQVVETITELGEDAALDSLKSKLPSVDVNRAVTELVKKGIVRRSYLIDEPQAKPRLVKGVTLAIDKDSALAAISKLTEKQARVVNICVPGKPIEVAELLKRAEVTSSVVSSLEKKGLLQSVEIARARKPNYTHENRAAVTLTEEQSVVLTAIREPIIAGQHETMLLHGVTASGKTEVYLRAIEETLEQDKSCLVLVPEISLTTQVMDIFKSRFGDQVAVLHSALSTGERHDEWMRLQSGEAKVALGPRSALFAPVKNLGLTIIDEEHEPTFKQENDPRYHARDVAIQRSAASNAAVVLGSATPAIESYYKALNGEYKLLEMHKRVESRPLPHVRVADLRDEYKKGSYTIFTTALKEAIAERLAKKEQVIIFQNRRAYSTLLLCRECGHVPHCPNCAVSLKLHSAEVKVRCHHCAYERPAPTVCPDCKGNKIGKFGIGTERVEEETRAMFPEARVLRMDRDTTSTKGSHGRILGEFRRREADILVGTQMIAKGLDFPNVTLVGVISADISLNLPDFRASERTFQLLSQVAGRAGRGHQPGEVIIQTFDPGHFAIQRAVEHDYVGFYNQEIAAREELLYPPFSTLINLISVDQNERAAQSRIEAVAEAIKRADCGEIELKGPVPAAIPKLRNLYRWHLVLKSAQRELMLDVLKSVFAAEPTLRRGLTVDVDPASML